MTPTGTSSTSASVRGGGSEAGSYFSTTPVQSTPRSSGYITAESTPTRTVRLPQESQQDDEEEEEDEEYVNNDGNGNANSDEDEDVATITAAMNALSTPTLTSTGSRPSTPSAIGLDFGDLDIDSTPRTGTRGHRSPVIC